MSISEGKAILRITFTTFKQLLTHTEQIDIEWIYPGQKLLLCPRLTYINVSNYIIITLLWYLYYMVTQKRSVFFHTCATCFGLKKCLIFHILSRHINLFFISCFTRCKNNNNFTKVIVLRNRCARKMQYILLDMCKAFA